MRYAVSAVCILLVLACVWWYRNLSESYPSGEEVLEDMMEDMSKDWRKSLTIDSKREALREYCGKQGYDYRVPTEEGDIGSCIYNKESCSVDSERYGTFNLWMNDKCITQKYAPMIYDGLCKERRMGWHPGHLECDEDGFCDASYEYEYLPGCLITPKLCKEYALDYTPHRGNIGNCTTSDTLNIFEGIFGMTFTRVYRKRFEEMVESCKDGTWHGCTGTIFKFGIVAPETFVKLVHKISTDLYDNISRYCDYEKNYTDARSTAECLYYSSFAYKIVDIAKGLGRLFLSLLEKMGFDYDSSMLKVVVDTSLKYGVYAVNLAINTSVEVMVDTFNAAGNWTRSALESVGLGAAADVLLGVANNIIEFGVGMCRLVVAYPGLLLNTKLVVYKMTAEVFTAISSVVMSFLDPMTFLNGIAKFYVMMFTNPVELLRMGFEAVKAAGRVMAAALKAFFEVFKIFFDAVAEAVKDTIRGVFNVVNIVFGTNIDPDAAFEAIGRAFSAVGDAANAVYRALQRVLSWLGF